MKKNILALLGVALVVAGFFFFSGREDRVAVEPQMVEYVSENIGVSFSHPDKYFVFETDVNDEENTHYAIVLIEDTPTNRALVAGELPGTDAPQTISLFAFDNSKTNYDPMAFINNSPFSNFALAQGGLTETNLGGRVALRYRATGLWENENVVAAGERFVYMFTVFFNDFDSPLVEDFERVLETVQFL